MAFIFIRLWFVRLQNDGRRPHDSDQRQHACDRNAGWTVYNGGLDVNVVGNRATLVSNGALAGSATNLMGCMRVAVKEMGIPLETAVACATVNPAKSLGEYDRYGSIAKGKKGNVVLLDQELEVKAVVKDGTLLGRVQMKKTPSRIKITLSRKW